MTRATHARDQAFKGVNGRLTQLTYTVQDTTTQDGGQTP